LVISGRIHASAATKRPFAAAATPCESRRAAGSGWVC
jgi:hypothetical protein